MRDKRFAVAQGVQGHDGLCDPFTLLSRGLVRMSASHACGIVVRDNGHRQGMVASSPTYPQAFSGLSVLFSTAFADYKIIPFTSLDNKADLGYIDSR